MERCDFGSIMTIIRRYISEDKGMNQIDFTYLLFDYSGSVVKTQIQSFYNELIYIVDKGEGYFPTRLHNQSTVLDSRRTLEFGC